MVHDDGCSTSPTLLRRVCDWHDGPAWHDFHGRYDPLLRRWCREMRIDDATAAELCQRIWIELADRIRSFRYDPTRSFRGWLRLLFESRATDLFRERNRNARLSLDDPGVREMVSRFEWTDRDPAEGDSPSNRAALLELGAAAQNAVRKRVTAETWQAFWMIAVEDQSVRDTAAILGKTYAAAFYAHRRVEKMLYAEGQRRVNALGEHSIGTVESRTPLSE